jgi:hypothetical protein
VPEGAPGSVRPGALPLGRTAELVGAYRWVELALYRALGEWSVSIPLPEAQLVLAEQSARHAWHAELWADRLPVLDGVDPDALTAPPGPAAPVLAALVGAEDAALPGVLPRLAGLYRVVLPRLVVTYRDHLARTVPATDAPTARALRLVLADEEEDWRVGERLVQRLLSRPHDVEAVAAALERLEGVAVAAGLRAGLVTLPRP